jgi:serine protease Do
MKMRMLGVSLVVTLAALLSPLAGPASAAPAQVSPLEEVVARVQPSVVFFDITWTAWVYDTYNKTYLNGGDPFTIFSYCTGFVVDPDGYIATAGHCVDRQAITPDFLDKAAAWALKTDYYVGGKDFTQVRKWAEDDYRVEGAKKGAANSYTKGADLDVQAVWSTSATEPVYDKYGDLTGTPYGARVEGLVPWNDGAGDTAILKVDAPEALPALPLATEADITTGTDIVSVGYPASVASVSDLSLADPSFKEGSISSVRTTGLYPVYETSASLSGGMSGGPTVNLQGEVVGINSFGIVGETDTFEFIQAVGTLDDLLGDEGIDAEVGEPGTSYQAGLDALYAGDKSKAVKNLTTATEAAPDFVMAEEFLADAKDLPAPPPPDSGSLPIVGIVAVIAGLALVAGGLFIIRNRRKKEEPTVLPAPPEAAPEPVAVTDKPEPEKVPSDGNAAPLTGWFCTNCGMHMESSAAKFCARCGTARPVTNPPDYERLRRGTV